MIFIVNEQKIGYKLELFLRNFKINSVYLDRENPFSTNLHFFSEFKKGKFKILIMDQYSFNRNLNKKTSKKMNVISKFTVFTALEQIENPTIFFFDFIDPFSIEEVSSKGNVDSVYHFITKQRMDEFYDDYTQISKDIKFEKFEIDEEQLSHLRYRCEDVYNHITKNDIKKTKLKKINQELLHSKKLQQFFKDNPEEKKQVIKNINDNNIRVFKSGIDFIPSYLVHNKAQNPIAEAIDLEIVED